MDDFVPFLSVSILNAGIYIMLSFARGEKIPHKSTQLFSEISVYSDIFVQGGIRHSACLQHNSVPASRLLRALRRVFQVTNRNKTILVCFLKEECLLGCTKRNESLSKTH